MTPRPTHCAAAALALLATSVLVALYQTLALSAQVNPAVTVASDYVFYPHGALLLTVSIVALLLAGLALLAGLTGAATPAPRSARALSGAWGLGLILLLDFPTDPPGHPLSLHGAIHRYAGATVFTTLPAAGWILARHLHNDPRWHNHTSSLRRYSAAAAASAAILGTYQTPPPSPRPPNTVLTDPNLQGLAERIALAGQITLLLALAHALWHVTRDHHHNQPPARQRPPARTTSRRTTPPTRGSNLHDTPFWSRYDAGHHTRTGDS